ncbi:hypothetical protein ROLI_045370 (plasmid) [Roseobacter fucihabitans]|uniref:Sulfotransferase domain-containing protein n=1 Tax=Roseobacter fucihabitans TaxID=1537242 RepID=A0ABZ2C1F9_9RHOB|nr:hypothetical protein [Roseobacter litoralis]MBC6967252.1 hypothetical protein [Roseobacter litoralis]
MNAQPQTLLHVGLHKCGSTWLQKEVFNRPDYGISAPWGPMSHQAVTEFVAIDPLCFDPKAARARFDEVRSDDTAGNDVAVISHEALSSRPHHGKYYAPDVAHRLARTFPEAKVFMMFREQSSIIYSLYGEHVRNGGQHSFEEFIGTGNEPAGWAPLCRLSFFEYDRLLQMYRDIFGADNVLALPLELMKSDPDAFMQRFFGFLDLPVQYPDTSRKSNAGWGGLTVDLYRRSNGLVRRNPLGGPISWAFRIRFALTRRLNRIIPRRWHKRSEQRKRDALRARIDNTFVHSNSRLAQMVDVDLKALSYH